MALFDINPNKNLLPKDGTVNFYGTYFSNLDANRYFQFLHENINWKSENIFMFGKMMPIPRLTAWYGDNQKGYTYSGIKLENNPWIPELLEIKEAVEKVSSVKFNSVLLNLYRNGNDSVSWHCDNEKELGLNPEIASVSFGTQRTFLLRHLKEKELVKSFNLQNGSLLIMKDETQHKWEHSIPKDINILTPRINLTFRVIK